MNCVLVPFFFPVVPCEGNDELQSRKIGNEFSSSVKCKLTIYSVLLPSQNLEALHSGCIRPVKCPRCFQTHLAGDLRADRGSLPLQTPLLQSFLLSAYSVGTGNSGPRGQASAFSGIFLGVEFLKDFFDHVDKFSFKFRHIYPQADRQTHAMNRVINNTCRQRQHQCLFADKRALEIISDGNIKN